MSQVKATFSDKLPCAFRHHLQPSMPADLFGATIVRIGSFEGGDSPDNYFLILEYIPKSCSDVKRIVFACHEEGMDIATDYPCFD